MRGQHTSLLAESGASTTTLERANLQVEGLKSSLAELQEKHNEVERTNADLLRQLEKWRNLDKREGDEATTLRKEKIELEIRVKELEKEVTEISTLAKEKTKAKIDKFKASLEEHTVCFGCILCVIPVLIMVQKALEERDEELNEKETEIETLKKKLAESEEQVKVLGTQLDAEQEKARAVKPTKVCSEAVSTRDYWSNDDFLVLRMLQLLNRDLSQGHWPRR